MALTEEQTLPYYLKKKDMLTLFHILKNPQWKCSLF